MLNNTIKILILFILFACTETSQSTSNASNGNNPAEGEAPELRHMVIFKFTDSAANDAVEASHQAFLALENSIPVIKDFEWGLNNSPENLHQDFTHCYLITFESEYDRDSVYLPHPEHLKFVEGLQPHIEKAFVIDYWVN